MIKRLDGEPYAIPIIRADQLREGMVFGAYSDGELKDRRRFLVLRTEGEARYLQLPISARPKNYPVSALCYDYPLDESVGTGLDGQLHVTAVTPL